MITSLLLLATTPSTLAAPPSDAEAQALFQAWRDANADRARVIARDAAAPLRVGEKAEQLLTVYQEGDLVIAQDPKSLWYDEALSRLTTDGLEWITDSIYDAFYSVQGDDYQYLTVLLVRDLELFFAFYQPLANDAEGIGYSNFLAGFSETFDNTPDTQIEGFIFMNYVGLWADHPELGCWVFGQEFGHRWGAFVDVDVDGVDMLGRDDSHWSYWLDIGNSPLEGNAWDSNGDGSYSVDATADGNFSDLDLYLMGFLPPEEVADMTFLQVSGPEQLSLDRSESSSPEHFDYLYGYGTTNITTYANPITVTIDDVIEANGERSPTSDEAPRDFKMGFLVLALEGDPVDADTLATVDGVRESWETCWATQTRGLSSLDTSLDGGGGDTADTGADTAGGDDTDGGVGDSGGDVEVSGKGCGCASAPAAGGGLAWLALAGIVGWRRRSS